MILTGKTKLLMVIAATLFAATMGLGIYYISSGSSSAVTVEDFSGSSKEAVLSWAKENKVREDRIEFQYEFDEEAETDTIIGQSIRSGEPLNGKDPLIITLSNGPDPDLEVTLADFTGMSQKEIEAWFEKNRFTNVQYSFGVDETVEADRFLSCSPECGRSARRSDVIKVKISSGSKEESNERETEVTVPDFSAYTRANIQAWGSTNRITVVFNTQASDTTPKDKVISQNPKAGSKIKTGSSITVVLSLGKGLTVMSFTGKQKAEADAWIQKNGLRAVYNEVFSESAAGLIISQNPTGGAITAGSSITFQVSAGLVPVNDCTGRPKAEFESYIADLNRQKNASAKLSLSISEQESDQPAGTILKQSASGAMKPGSAITITVAVGKKITVADKSGSTEDAFRAYLSSLTLKPGNISYAYHDTIAKGSIIRNDTGTFSAGNSINYTVSRGAYVFSYGTLINAGSSWAALDSAASEARANGWSVTAASVESKDYDAGIIIETCSVSGKSIACKVSSGRVVTVPNTIGSGYEAAISALKAAGLNAAAVETVDYRDEPAGTVIGQSIAAGNTVKAGTTVTVTYSKGPKPVVTEALPNFNIAFWDGQTEAKIRADMTAVFHNAGFHNLSFTVKDTSTGDNTNGIESISPAPDGAVIDVETPIHIVILVGKSS